MHVYFKVFKGVKSLALLMIIFKNYNSSIFQVNMFLSFTNGKKTHSLLKNNIYNLWIEIYFKHLHPVRFLYEEKKFSPILERKLSS